jgi:hypothetical protein
MKPRSVLSVTVVLLALSDIWSAFAVPSAMSHEMSGTVQRIDRKTVTILLTGSSKPVGFAWNLKETQFIRNGIPATIDSLPIGASVQIRCSHPIVGSMPLLYRVSWHAVASGNKSKSY